MGKTVRPMIIKSNPELIEASSHLKYEIWMLFSSMECFMHYQSSIPNTPRNSILCLPKTSNQIQTLNSVELQVHKNSFLQSFLVHFRNLACFIYDISGKPDNDVVATHYFNDPKEWWKIRPKKGKSIGQYLDNISKTIVHLTYFRKDSTRRQWPLRYMSMSIGRPLIKFSNMVSEKRVIENFKQDVSNVLRKYGL